MPSVEKFSVQKHFRENASQAIFFGYSSGILLVFIEFVDQLVLSLMESVWFLSTNRRFTGPAAVDKVWLPKRSEEKSICERQHKSLAFHLHILRSDGITFGEKVF